MKFPNWLLLMFILSSTLLFAEDNKEKINDIPQNVRVTDFDDMFLVDSVEAFFNSPCFSDFQYLNFDNVDSVYRINRMYVDSVIAADSLNPNFWRVYGGQFFNTFRQAGVGTRMSLLLFLPWFLVILAVVFLYHFIRVFFVHRKLAMPDKLDINPDGELANNDEFFDEDQGQGSPEN